MRDASLVAPRGDRAPICPGFEATLFAESSTVRARRFSPQRRPARRRAGGGQAGAADRRRRRRPRRVGARCAGASTGRTASPSATRILRRRPPSGRSERAGEQRPRPPPRRRPASCRPRREADVIDGRKLLTAKGVFGLPQGHANRTDVGPDGRLYVASAPPAISRRARAESDRAILRRDGSNQKTSSPSTQPGRPRLSSRDRDLSLPLQERDGVGDRLVPDFLARARPPSTVFPTPIRPDPAAWIAGVAPDKVTARRRRPAVQPHSAAMDLVCYTRRNTPASSRRRHRRAQGFVNRTEPTGCKIVRVSSRAASRRFVRQLHHRLLDRSDDKAVVSGRQRRRAGAERHALYRQRHRRTIWRVTARRRDRFSRLRECSPPRQARDAPARRRGPACARARP